MSNDWRKQVLPQIVEQLARRPGHEETRVAVVRLLTDGLGAAAGAITHEFRMPVVRGRADAADAKAIAETYRRLKMLYDTGRDGIWPYVLRNLVRPLWLSRPEQRADVLLGNPPWVAYRHLSAALQRRLRDASERLNLWVGANLATQQDLCALFTVRGAQLYLKAGGRLGLVLPYLRQQIAAMQPKGQGGARDFDNLMWELPIPQFAAGDALHQDLACLCVESERVAAAVPLVDDAYFTTQRRAIRDALAASGLPGSLDKLVARLLDP